MACRGEKPGLRAVGRFGCLLGGGKRNVAFLQTSERRCQFIGAALDLPFQIDCCLEQGKGIALLIHRAFDAVHQGTVDQAQLVKIINGIDKAHSAASTMHRPKAMPVKVWLRCMELNCSP